MVVAAAFVAFSLPPYLSLDPAQSRVPAPDFFPPHFAVLSLHVVFGSIAMITCCLQIWPWFRARYPRAHRRIGRVYVFAGCLPSGLLGLTVGVATPWGPVTMVSNVLLALLWLGCTLAGWRMARQRRFADHRRWMVRSFALTMSIVTNRIYGVLFGILFFPPARHDLQRRRDAADADDRGPERLARLGAAPAGGRVVAGTHRRRQAPRPHPHPHPPLNLTTDHHT
ncbi:hypothetical protein GCM10020001_008770 [Nonomuraea salmonea]